MSPPPTPLTPPLTPPSPRAAVCSSIPPRLPTVEALRFADLTIQRPYNLKPSSVSMLSQLPWTHVDLKFRLDLEARGTSLSSFNCSRLLRCVAQGGSFSVLRLGRSLLGPLLRTLPHWAIPQAERTEGDCPAAGAPSGKDHFRPLSCFSLKKSSGCSPKSKVLRLAYSPTQRAEFPAW